MAKPVPVPEDAVGRLWRALEAVCDPEIPVLSVVDLGVVRGVEVSGGAAVVSITPTYSGCPAMQVIEGRQIVRRQIVGIKPRRLERREDGVDQAAFAPVVDDFRFG